MEAQIEVIATIQVDDATKLYEVAKRIRDNGLGPEDEVTIKKVLVKTPSASAFAYGINKRESEIEMEKEKEEE